MARLIEGQRPAYWKQKSGLDVPTICARYFGLGWSLEKTLNTPVNRHGVTYKGVFYPTFKALCVEHGMNEGTVWKRVKAGMSLEEALKTPIGKAKRPKNPCGHDDCETCPHEDCIA